MNINSSFADDIHICPFNYAQFFKPLIIPIYSGPVYVLYTCSSRKNRLLNFCKGSDNIKPNPDLAIAYLKSAIKYDCILRFEHDYASLYIRNVTAVRYCNKITMVRPRYMFQATGYEYITNLFKLSDRG